MTSVIAAHSCQQLTMGKQARACQGKIFQQIAGSRLHCQWLQAFPACLAFSAQQNAKRRLGTPPLQGLCQAAALSFNAAF
jgi:hypothetical protein